MRKYICLKQNVWQQGDYSIVPVQPEHIESIRLWRNAQLDVLRQPSSISQKEQVLYYEKNIWPNMAIEQPKNILVGFLYSDKLIGYGGLVHISWHDKRAEVSFLLEPDCANNQRQYREAFEIFLYLIKKIAFDELQLNRVFTETYAIRKEHIAVLEAANFVLEGVMRQHVCIDSEYIDSLIHGVIRSENER